MPKINQEEYEVLKHIDDDYEWLARDWHDPEVRTYQQRPYKKEHYGWWMGREETGEIVSDLFQFIQWEDEEPHNIAELIEEYEIKELRLAPSGTVIVDSFDESEETEVKDLEWLREKLNSKAFTDTFGRNVILIGQKLWNELLDEVKIANKTYQSECFEIEVGEETYLVHEEAFNKIYDDAYMQGEADGEQKSKPTIPQFVADWIENIETKGVSSLYGTLRSLNAKLVSDSKWIEWNEETFENYGHNDPQELIARAWLDGYEVEVEEEQKYIVIIPHQLNNAFDLYLCETNEAIYFLDKEDEFNERVKYKFTEEEINKINPDYMTFAVPVEEMEE